MTYIFHVLSAHAPKFCPEAWDDALIFFAITLLTLLKLKLPRAVWMERMVRFSDPSPVFLSAYCGRSRPGSNAKSTAKSQ